MGPTRVNRKLPNECFESGEEQIKGYGKVTQNTEIFSTKYGNNISEVGSPVTWSISSQIHTIDTPYRILEGEVWDVFSSVKSKSDSVPPMSLQCYVWYQILDCIMTARAYVLRKLRIILQIQKQPTWSGLFNQLLRIYVHNRYALCEAYLWRLPGIITTHT